MTFKHLLAASAAASLLALGACSGGTDTKTEAPKKEAVVKAPVTLAEVIAHPRRAENTARDQFRNPKETLEFFEVGPGKKVGEVWPGWYTPIIAPYLAEKLLPINMSALKVLARLKLASSEMKMPLS